MIYLVRHGETTFNTAGRLQGQLDSPLTQLGNLQAEAMGKCLVKLIGGREYALFVSPLQRTLATAAIITRCLHPASQTTQDPRLMEISMGKWDGMTDFEIEMEYPGARSAFTAQDWQYHGPGGESFAVVRQRISAVMAEISAEPWPVKIVVSHGAVGRIIRGNHAGMTKPDMLALDAPQNALFALEPNGNNHRFQC